MPPLTPARARDRAIAAVTIALADTYPGDATAAATAIVDALLDACVEHAAAGAVAAAAAAPVPPTYTHTDAVGTTGGKATVETRR